MAPTVSCPPNTGVAKVYVGITNPRSAFALRLALTFAVRLAEILPVSNSRAAATLAPADTLV